MQENEEYEIIQACLRGDATAQERVYKQYYSTLLKICARYVQNMSDAELLLNDSYFKIFTHLSSYQATGSFEGWMKRITTNTCLDYVRSKDFLNGRKTSEIKEYNSGMSAHPEDDFIQKSEFKALLNLIQSLPNTMRAVFNLYVFEDYSHKEIGQQLGITENNSQWHLHQARKLLKDKILANKKNNKIVV